MTWLLVLLVIEIMLFCFVFLSNKKDIMAPSVVLSGVFIISTFISLLNVDKWNVRYPWEASFILSLGIMLFCVTDVLVSKSSLNRKMITAKRDIGVIRINRKKTWFIILIDIVVVYFVYNEVMRIAATNTWFDNPFYAYRILSSHSEDADPEQMMNGKIHQAMKIIIVSGFMYTFFFINNVIIHKENWKKHILFLVPPILLCTMTLITGVRTYILRLCVFCMICGYILLQHKRGWKITTQSKFIRIIVIALVVILVVFSRLQSLLGRDVSGSTDGFTVVSNYVGAPIIHFGQYIQNPPPPNKVLGQETFVGVWNVAYKLGITEQAYLAHEEHRRLTNTDTGNVYTLFRRFIQDFGIGGMCILTILLSWLFSYFYNRKIRNCTLDRKTVLNIMVYGYIFYIIAMASIDNLVHDYVNIGIAVMFVLLPLMYRFVVIENTDK